MIVYFYDIKSGKEGEGNRVKRLFYYHFNRIRLKDFSYKTKSVLIVADRYEKLLDGFFLGFKGKMEVYKIKTENIEQIC